MLGINYLAVLLCAVLAMIIGSIWYGPFFGKKWMKIIDVTALSLEERKKMQKSAGPLYLIQFGLILFQVLILAYFIQGLSAFKPIYVAFIVWLAFVMPILASVSMWNNDSRKVAWSRFLIQAGYQLILFVVFGLVLGWWK